MTYHKLTDTEKERIFAEDVLKWFKMERPVHGKFAYRAGIGDYRSCNPLTDLNHAMLGMERLIKENEHFFVTLNNTYINDRLEWEIAMGKIGNVSVHVFSDTPNEAIVEVCIHIVRPDLFEGEKK